MIFTSTLKPTKCWIVMGSMLEDGEPTIITPLKVFKFKHEAERYASIEKDFDTTWIEESRFYE